MNIMEHFENDKTVHDTLASFMQALEEWQSLVEGTPTEADMVELDKIYDIAEVNLRFIINNDKPTGDDTAPSEGGK